MSTLLEIKCRGQPTWTAYWRLCLLKCAPHHQRKRYSGRTCQRHTCSVAFAQRFWACDFVLPLPIQWAMNSFSSIPRNLRNLLISLQCVQVVTMKIILLNLGVSLGRLTKLTIAKPLYKGKELCQYALYIRLCRYTEESWLLRKRRALPFPHHCEMYLNIIESDCWPVRFTSSSLWGRFEVHT